MGVRLVTSMELRWDGDGDLYIMDMRDPDGGIETFAIPGCAFDRHSGVVYAAIQARHKAHTGCDALPLSVRPPKPH